MASRDALLNEIYELALQNEMNCLYDPEELKAFHEIGGHSRSGCPQICGTAPRTAADIILRLLEPA